MGDHPPSPASPGSVASQLLLPALIGTVTGACVAAMVGAIESWGLHRLSSLPGFLPALFAPAALILSFLASRYVTRVEKPSTSELYISLYHEPDARFPREQVPGRILATTATVGLGGSQGFESTSALVGVTWSDFLSRVPGLRISDDSRRTLMASGASAGIAAVFSSPAAGALYGIEVPFKRDVDSPRLVSCVVAGFCSYLVRSWLIDEQRIVTVQGLPTIDAAFLLACLIVAVASGLGARLFATVEHLLQRIGKRQTRLARAIIGGCVLTMLAIAGHAVCGDWITFGSGYIATGWLERETRVVEFLILALLVRACGNLVTVYGGGGGGVFTSLACNGAFVGEIVAILFDCDQTHTLALIGACCFLAAGYRLPLACMLFLTEAALGPFLSGVGIAAIAIAMIAMGSETVSDAQIENRDTPTKSPATTSG